MCSSWRLHLTFPGPRVTGTGEAVLTGAHRYGRASCREKHFPSQHMWSTRETGLASTFQRADIIQTFFSDHNGIKLENEK